jgi:hypothetical protein
MPNIPEKSPNHHNNLNFAVAVRTRAMNFNSVRRLFAGLEALMREARTTSDPRVLLAALRVLELQPANVRELLAEV